MGNNILLIVFVVLVLCILVTSCLPTIAQLEDDGEDFEDYVLSKVSATDYERASAAAIRSEADAYSQKTRADIQFLQAIHDMGYDTMKMRLDYMDTKITSLIIMVKWLMLISILLVMLLVASMGLLMGMYLTRNRVQTPSQYPILDTTGGV